MGIGVEGDFDPVTLRELAQNDLSPRLERVAGVAAVTSTAACAARFASTCRARRSPASTSRSIASSDLLTTENQNMPLGEVNDADRTLCCAARASSPTSTRSATWS